MKKQYVFLTHNCDLYSIYTLQTKSSLKSINQEFILFLKGSFVSESPLKIMTLSVLKIFKFLSWLFVPVEKWLDETHHIKFKFFDVRSWETNNCNTHISRSKGNRTMKFGQLIEYNMKTFSLKNHTQNMMEKAFPDSFVKYQNWACLWINSLNFYTVYFIVFRGLSKYAETKLQTTCFYLI